MSLTLRDVITESPHTIGEDQPLARAHEIMRLHDVRHLPVLRGGRLSGVVSLRDLHLVETMRKVDPAEVPVSEAMSPLPFAVDVDTPLLTVAETMAAMKYGSAVAMSKGKVVGVFTTIDAMRTLAWFLARSRGAAKPPRSGTRLARTPAKSLAARRRGPRQKAR
jgi:acetoin utilization protein AcuB